MKTLFFILTLTVTVQIASAQWIKQAINTTASFRGLSVVNEKIIWASGTEGTVIKTIDGGKTWKVIQVPGAEKLDFRDIEAFDANTAYILSIGNGESSRIYKTTDGGTKWTMEFKNDDSRAFYDAIACADRDNCIALSDPIDGYFVFARPVPVMFRDPKLRHWGRWDPLGGLRRLAQAEENEAAFAASGTCLILFRNNYFIVTGGNAARVFRATGDPMDWRISDPGFVKGVGGSGIFSIAMNDPKRGVIVGGNYEKPDEHERNLAFTTDGGETWKLGNGLSGYRSAVAYIDGRTIIAVGTNGTDITRDGGKAWKKIGDENLNAVAAKGNRAVWAVGPKGMVVKMKRPR